MGLSRQQVVIVSDIGCSGLFDTFFNTHAFHGLHGRALTYATGLKMARPDLKVVVTMGDGGLGIGGAHLLSTCRRNIDLTLLVLNNFNYGMTGGQCSSTTPPGGPWWVPVFSTGWKSPSISARWPGGRGGLCDPHVGLR
jgi:2-oxoglutarate ferredoxin oxidoreductase subunit beta